MALWMVRTGRHGEHEIRFLDDQRIYATWWAFNHDLRSGTRQELAAALDASDPDSPRGRITTHTSQLWNFAHAMQVGDLVAVPLKSRPAIHIGEIVGEYVYDPSASDPYYHHRAVKWLRTDVPRTSFDKDILLSLGAQMTIGQVRAAEAEERVRRMARSSDATALKAEAADDLDAPEQTVDLERVSRDEIAKRIIAKFKGHGLAGLVAEILRAQGYHTFLSPEGADKGVDILAAGGPMGFEEPRICVQVKSGDGQVDGPTFQQLVGTMKGVGASHGLLVSWGGFKSSIERQHRRDNFFSVRLWDQYDVVDQLLRCYDRLGSEFQSQIPLKQIWTIVEDDD